MTTQQTATTEYLQVDGVDFAYRILGNNSTQNSPLLCLNHYRGTTDTWDPSIINPIAATRPVILFDYAGIGHSGGTVQPSIQGMANDLNGFLAALLALLHLAKVDILAFSLSSFVAQQLVLDAPNFVGKMILSGSQPSLSPGLSPWSIDSLETGAGPNATEDVFSKIFFATSAKSQTAAHAWWERIHERQLPGEQYADFLEGTEAVGNLTLAYLGWLADPIPASLLPAISNDILLTSGQFDSIVPLPNSLLLDQHLPNSRLVVYPDAGHGHLFQWAGLYVQQVLEFLDGIWEEV